MAASNAAASMHASAPPTPEGFERERVRRELRAQMFGGDVPRMRLGRYSVVDRIAAGGTSIVYLAHDEELDRPVALKLVMSHGGRGAELRSRLTREGRALARLDHPAAVRVYDVGLEQGLAFIVVELVEGETLADWLARGPHDWRAVLELLLPVGDALTAAHAVGLVHRDVKPANVLLDERGTPRLADFGFSHVLGVAATGDAVGEATGEAAAPQLLRSQASVGATGVVGTPAYMAPEQWQGGACDARTDQFGFCVILHEALHGERPALPDGRAGLASTDAEPPPSETSAPAWLSAIAARGLAADADARFASLGCLLDEVRRRLGSVLESGLAVAAVARCRRTPEPARRLELALEARRSFEKALTLWPDNVDAQLAEAELLEWMFDDAVAQRELPRAAALLPSVHDADGSRSARLARLRTELEEPARRLEQLEHDRDTSVEERFKSRSIAFSAAAWTLAYVAYAALDRLAVVDVTPLSLLPFFVLYAALGWLGLRRLPTKYAANRVNRDLTIVASIVTTGHALAMLACVALQADVATALMFAHVQAATGYAIAGLAYDRRAAWLTPSNVLGGGLIAMWPSFALEVSAAIVPLGSAAWVLSHRGTSRAAASDDAASAHS